jgi:hypothetical protein
MASHGSESPAYCNPDEGVTPKDPSLEQTLDEVPETLRGAGRCGCLGGADHKVRQNCLDVGQRPSSVILSLLSG